MNEFVEFLGENSSIIYFILGIIASIIIGYIFFKWSKNNTFIGYKVDSFNLVNNKLNSISGLEISYKKKNIKNLTSTNITFSNSGNNPIKKNDIAPKDKLKIYFTDDTEILGAEIIRNSNKNNGLNTKLENNIINVKFDFLDVKDIAIINIFHTSTSGDNVVFNGTVIGGKPIKKVDMSNYKTVKALSFLMTRIAIFPLPKYLRIIPILMFLVLFFPIMVLFLPFIMIEAFSLNHINLLFFTKKKKKSANNT